MTSQTDEADARAPASHRRGMRGVEWSLFYQFKAFSHHHRVYVSSSLIIHRLLKRRSCCRRPRLRRRLAPASDPLGLPFRPSRRVHGPAPHHPRRLQPWETSSHPPRPSRLPLPLRGETLAASRP